MPYPLPYPYPYPCFTGTYSHLPPQAGYLF
jgi:hypothetical protein